jgi:two-component system, cell cycle sensor histidine kinase and response regulator CckA
MRRLAERSTVTERRPTPEPDIHRLVVEHALDLVSVLDERGRIVYASPSHERVLGHRPEDLVGTDPLELVHPHDREAARGALGAGSGLAPRYRLSHRDGQWVYVEGHATPIPGDEPRYLVVSRDVTARERAERRRDAQHGVTRVVAASRTVAQAADAVLRVVGETLFWELGLLWRADGETLRLVALWQAHDLATREVEAISRRIVLRAGECLPGRVWETGEPAWTPDVIADRDLPPRGPDDREGLHSAIAVPVAGGGGTWGVLEFCGRKVRGHDDDRLRVFASFGGQLGQFIERTHAEEAVRAEEARKRAIVESALDAIVTMDHSGRIVEFNPAAERIFGHPASAVVGRPLADVLIPPALRDSHRSGLERYLDSGESRILGERIEMKALHADGHEIPVELAITRVNLPGPPLFSGYIRDITDRKRAEDALQGSRAMLAAIIDGTPDAVFVKDRDGRYLLINEAGAAALGRTVEEVLGRDDTAVMEPEAAADIMERDRAVMDSGETVIAEESVIAEGVSRIFLATKAAYRDAAGEVVGLIGIAHDVTDRRRLEAELQQAQKMEAIGRMAGGVAHDFNNILSVIRGFSDLAQKQLDGADAAVDDWLQQVTRAADQGTALTRQLLSISRREPIETEVLQLNAVVAEMDALLRRVLGEDLRLVTVFGASPGAVEANRGQLEQVIMNLAVNARDAMPGGGKLTIETADTVLDEEAAGRLGLSPGAYVALRVSDTGCGMDADVRTRIFEPFFTTKGAGRGTGLGLSTVYGIVSQNGGHIGVHSAPGAGSTFMIHLPAARPVAVAPEVADAAAVGAALTGTLLVAEDDDVLRGLIQAMLEEGGYDVLTARTGEEALETAAAFQGGIDALVTDVVMPGMRGPDLAARLRAQRDDLRVVFITGYGNHPFEQELRPGDTFLTKPFGMEALLSALGEVLPDRGARRTAR